MGALTLRVNASSIICAVVSSVVVGPREVGDVVHQNVEVPAGDREHSVDEYIDRVRSLRQVSDDEIGMPPETGDFGDNFRSRLGSPYGDNNVCTFGGKRFGDCLADAIDRSGDKSGSGFKTLSHGGSC